MPSVEGVSGYGLFGQRVSIAWIDVVTVKRFLLFYVWYLRIRSGKTRVTLWLPMPADNPKEMLKALENCAGTDHAATVLASKFLKGKRSIF